MFGAYEEQGGDEEDCRAKRSGRRPGEPTKRGDHMPQTPQSVNDVVVAILTNLLCVEVGYP